MKKTILTIVLGLALGLVATSCGLDPKVFASGIAVYRINCYDGGRTFYSADALDVTSLQYGWEVMESSGLRRRVSGNCLIVDAEYSRSTY